MDKLTRKALLHLLGDEKNRYKGIHQLHKHFNKCKGCEELEELIKELEKDG